jgi:hypothetical protein
VIVLRLLSVTDWGSGGLAGGRVGFRVADCYYSQMVTSQTTDDDDFGATFDLFFDCAI